MTWELQATVSDDIHRLVNRQGETLWGVAHRELDAGHPEAVGEAEVDLPTGPTSLLLVNPLSGGLVLDAVRSYQGLLEGELSTLFLGIFDELLHSSEAEARLCLECIGLDAEGRPRIIPGVRRVPTSTTRFAIGEMIYHAAHGRPWKESLLPVNIALPDCSQPLRTLVAELLDESAVDSTLQETIAEVSVALRRTGAPSALPLLPAERDLDPGQALTARLRATTAPSVSRSPEKTSAAGRLRAASRESPRKKPVGFARRQRNIRSARKQRSIPLTSSVFTALKAGGRALRERLPTSRRRTGRWMTGLRACMILAVFATVIGGALMLRLWIAEDPAASVSSSQGHAGTMTEEQVFAVLEDLCEKRATALSTGDEVGLKALTIPNSSAAAADELLELEAFVGNAYSIEVDDPDITEQTDGSILVNAHMSASASADGEESGFSPRHVEFELALDAGTWKIVEVTEIGR